MARKKQSDDFSGQGPMPKKKFDNPFYDLLRTKTHRFDAAQLAAWLKAVDRGRYRELSVKLAEYVGPNLQATIKKKGGIANYRINPYVLMAGAGVMNLADPARLADFIFNNKLYAGLETSFGKSLEKLFLTQ